MGESVNNRDSIASAAYVTEAPSDAKRSSRGREERVCAAQSRCTARLRTVPSADIQGEKAAGSVTEQTRAIAPMLLRLCTIVLLVLASLRVNAASVTGVLIADEAASSPAVNVAAVYPVHTRIRSGLTDLGSVGGAQNQMETRREYEDSLKTYRELAKKEPETYLPYVAATLNDLGILDSGQNRIGKALKEFEEALKTYRELAHKEPDIYLRYLAITLNNGGRTELPGGGAENLPRTGAEGARDLSALHGDNTQQPWDI